MALAQIEVVDVDEYSTGTLPGDQTSRRAIEKRKRDVLSDTEEPETIDGTGMEPEVDLQPQPRELKARGRRVTSKESRLSFNHRSVGLI